VAGIPRYKDFDGPPLFRQGFRPFFLGAAVWVALAVGIWLLVMSGGAALPTVFGPRQWHAHEMIFGFAAAAATGFLLTAVPNWTGRMPLQGLPLIILFSIWILGRIAMMASAPLGGFFAAVIDLSFLALLFAVVLREVTAGRNWRNLPVVSAIALLLAANLLTHLEATGVRPNDPVGERLGVAVFVLLISLIGGRIIPSFTRNWLVKHGSTTLPVPFNRFDIGCLALVAASLGLWVAVPEAQITGFGLIMAGAVSVVRLVRWTGWLMLSEPLLWILHLGYAWLAFGLLLLGGSVLAPAAVPNQAGLHALTAGAMGTMILAVMTRATLAHTGRALSAGPSTVAIYGLVSAAAITRVLAPFLPGSYVELLWSSGGLWILAFALFVVRYAPMLLTDNR